MDNCEHITTTTVELNNSGVALLLQGDYKSAIASFAKALETSSKEQKHKMEGAADDETACVLQESLDHWMSKSMRLDEKMTAVDEQGASSPAPPFVCRLPIHIITSSVAPSTSTCFRSEVMTSAVLFFNTALTYHESVMDEKDKNASSPSSSSSANANKLGKAALLYELAYKLQLECSCQNPLFIMAIINNLGTVYDLLDKKESAEKCFQHLLSTLMFNLVVVGAVTATGAGAAGCEVDAVSSSNLDGFRTNTFYLYLQDLCTAAAA
jgi:tetratricopeptide (TPR) repeat protein